MPMSVIAVSNHGHVDCQYCLLPFTRFAVHLSFFTSSRLLRHHAFILISISYRHRTPLSSHLSFPPPPFSSPFLFLFYQHDMESSNSLLSVYLAWFLCIAFESPPFPQLFPGPLEVMNQCMIYGCWSVGGWWYGIGQVGGLANAGMYVVVMNIASRLGPSICNRMMVYKSFFAYLPRRYIRHETTLCFTCHEMVEPASRIDFSPIMSIRESLMIEQNTYLSS